MKANIENGSHINVVIVWLMFIVKRAAYRILEDDGYGGVSRILTDRGG